MLQRVIRKLLGSNQKKPVTRRAHAERLEPRCVLDAAPIQVGLVYIETDYLESGFADAGADLGDDSQSDQFQLSFVGGAENTQLTRIVIDTDKDGDGITIGDPIFDTQAGGRGKAGFGDFEIVSYDAANPNATVTHTSVDGGTQLILEFTNFFAGDKLVFGIEVDEVLRLSDDLDVFNSRLDVITSGQEFQDSILTATFSAPHYFPVTGSDIFENDYGDPAASSGLDLPPDSGNNPLSRPDRTAAALFEAIQTPRPISIAGTVYLDHDLDLTQETGEPGLSDVELRLFQLDETTGSYEFTGHSTQTNAQGDYEFGVDLALSPGTYRVEETQPTGLFSVGAVPGTVEGSNVGAVFNDDVLTGIEILLGDTRAIDYDFAEAEPARISGFVYRDDSNDGIKDPNEPGLGGVGVRLIPVDTIATQTILETLTEADGSYEFVGLSPGQYRVIETNVPYDLDDGLDTAGTVQGIVIGQAINPGDEINDIFLNGGDSGINYNFGELPLSSISGFVFLAAPGEDCTADHALVERALEDVRIALQDELGNTIAETRTDSDGFYEFVELPRGEYQVVEFTPDGLLDGAAHVGTIDGSLVGEMADPGRITRIVMPSASSGLRYDFCEHAPAEVSGYVYHDEDINGVFDPTDDGIPDVTVELLDENGTVVETTTTDDSGFYRFTDVVPGNYMIRETTPAEFLDGIDTAGTIDGTTVGLAENPGDKINDIVLLQGQTGVHYDFGEILPGSISGRVHVDNDGDCVLDPGEVTLSNIPIQLFDDLGNLIATTTTDLQGNYRFDGLGPGSYTIVETQPDGYFNGGQSPGTTGGDGSQENVIRQVALGAGENSEENNFCEEPPSSISGRVHVETDGNCVLNPGELTLRGITIRLYDDAGTLIATTVTNANGEYEFAGLPKGTYTVVETQPLEYFNGNQSPGTTGGDGSIDNTIAQINLGPGQNSQQNDFCETPPAAISGYVFQEGLVPNLQEAPAPEDLREIWDGQRTTDDIPLANVVLELRNRLGEPVVGSQALPGIYADGPIRTFTDENGFYEFTGLADSVYQVYQVQPDGFIDGLDTPSAEARYAVNAADQPDNFVESFVAALSLSAGTDPGTDGILLIDLFAGAHSVENNFSEVKIDPLLPPPPEPPEPPEPPRIDVTIETFPTPPIQVSIPNVGPIVRPILAELEDGFTWHLSVIDGGFPRGEDAVQTGKATIIQKASVVLDTAAWSSNPRSRGYWVLMDREGNLLPESGTMNLGDENAIPLAGDFNGDSRDEIAIFIEGDWFIDVNGNGRWDTDDMWVKLGTDMDLPVVGDWDGDGKDDIGIFGPEWPRDPQAILQDPGLPDPENSRRARPKNPPPMEPEATDGERLLRLKNQGDLRRDLIDHVFRYGHGEDVPLAGDWNGDGIDTIAVFRSGKWMLDADGDGRWTARDLAVEYGEPGDRPVVGDWNGDGIDDPGVVRGDLWIIDSDGDRELTESDRRFKQPPLNGQQPVAGDWDGDGTDEAGSYETKDEPQENDKAA